MPIRSMATVGEPRILSRLHHQAPQRNRHPPGHSQRVMDLTVVIPAADEEPNLALLMPQIVAVLDSLRIAYEILVVLPAGNAEAAQEGWPPTVRASRYVTGGTAEMPMTRPLLSA